MAPCDNACADDDTWPDAATTCSDPCSNSVIRAFRIPLSFWAVNRPIPNDSRTAATATDDIRVWRKAALMSASAAVVWAALRLISTSLLSSDSASPNDLPIVTSANSDSFA